MEYKFDQPLRAIIGTEKYQCTIEWRNGKFVADEPPSSGGKDTGPDPYTLLLSSLASCTLITLRMYIDRKGWDIPRIAVNANYFTETVYGKPTTVIDCHIKFHGEMDEAKELRLQEIAKRCPISRILEGEIKVRTFLIMDGEAEKKSK